MSPNVSFCLQTSALSPPVIGSLRSVVSRLAWFDPSLRPHPEPPAADVLVPPLYPLQGAFTNEIPVARLFPQMKPPGIYPPGNRTWRYIAHDSCFLPVKPVDFTSTHPTEPSSRQERASPHCARTDWRYRHGLAVDDIAIAKDVFGKTLRPACGGARVGTLLADNTDFSA